MSLLDIPTDAADVRPEPKRDRWGRYMIPDPATGAEVAWTRATTFAKSCSDTFGLTKWELRMVALGLAKRADLLAQAASVVDPDDRDAKKLLDTIATQAKEAAGSSVRSNLGTALHTMTEHLDAGRTFDVPDAHRADLDAYRAATRDLRIDPAHIERIVTVPRYRVAGTLDRLVTLDGRLMVADLKTGRSLAGIAEYAIQLALYANAETMWDVTTGAHEPMPAVDKEQALIIWLPAGEARCELHTVDIAAGWEMAQTCETVRAWRSRRNLSAPWTPSNRIEPPFPEHKPTTADEWITGRINTLVASTGAKAMLAQLWPGDTPKRAPWTDEQVDAIVPILERIETAFEAPFPYSDPRPKPEPELPPAARQGPRQWPAPDDGPTVAAADSDALKARAATLDDARRALCSDWMADGKRNGCTWGAVVDGAWTGRRWSVNRAALFCAEHLYDADDPSALTRAALADVLGEDLGPSWPTGAVLGRLSVDQADQLADIAAAFGANDAATCARLGERIAAA